LIQVKSLIDKKMNKFKAAVDQQNAQNQAAIKALKQKEDEL